MTREFTADELLPLSGIQHFTFCRRQWALMFVERQWKENVLTVEGTQMHQRVDDPYFSEVRKGVVITRSVPVASYRLGVNGVCDLVEFIPAQGGVSLPGRLGFYLPAAVEYKHGKEKHDSCDEAQLCAQTICLEEMLSVEIPLGYLYYGATRRRVEVEMSGELRELVWKSAAEMHEYFARGYTPLVKPHRGCRSCSIADLCVPEIQGKAVSVADYIHAHVEGD